MVSRFKRRDASARWKSASLVLRCVANGEIFLSVKKRKSDLQGFASKECRQERKNRESTIESVIIMTVYIMSGFAMSS